MSAFKNRTAFEVAKKMKAFLSLDTGFMRRTALGRRVWQQLAGENGQAVALRKGLARARSVMRLPDPSRQSPPIFFVVGYQKSGTTWLMKMLDSHPEILCQGEGRPFGRDWRREHLKEKRASYPPTSLYNAIVSSEDLRYWVERSVWSRRDDVDEHLTNLTGLAIEYFLTQRLLKTGKRMAGDKTVLLTPEIVKEIGAVCPKAKVIHIIRDGRDVVVSSMHHRWNQAEDQGGTGKISPEQLAKREAYRENPQMLLETDEGLFANGGLTGNAVRWSTRVGETVKDGPVLLGDNYIEVRYEDLLERSEEEVRRLLKFLGADAAEQTVKACVNAASFEKLSGGRKRGQEAASFFRKGIAGDWKNVFTERNKQDFKAVAGELLIELGYEEDNNW